MTVKKVFLTPNANPPDDVIQAIESGIVEHTRRIEILEADGETLWRGIDQSVSRLEDGNVTVDYGSAERRKLDLVLDNRDGEIRPDPRNGFWYDKVIRVYRGVRYKGSMVTPRSAVIEAPSASDGRGLVRMLSSIGLKDAEYISLPDEDNTTGFQYVFAFSRSVMIANHLLLKDLWAKGVNIITIGTGSNENRIPLYTSSTTEVRQWGISPSLNDSPAAGRFVASSVGGSTVGGAIPTGFAAGVVPLSVWPNASAPEVTTAAMGVSPAGGVWLDVRVPEFDNVEVRKLIDAVVKFMRSFDDIIDWEVPQGTFMIDTIADQHFPQVVKITGRDFTKKLILYKMQRSVSFAAGTKVKALVESLAANAGIPHSRHLVAIDDNDALEVEMAFSAGTTAWDIIKDACEAFGYEVYFDGFGNFTVRKFRDPSTSAPMWTFKTGYEENPDGANLVSYDRSTSDSRIFNWIVVSSTGESPDNPEGIPRWAEAKNTEPSSPTSIDRLGPRVDVIESNWLTTDAECQTMATNRLKIAALESYEMNISSIYYPWMEVGEIVEVLDPKRTDIEPTRFLLDSLSYPIQLGPMTATAKRVTYVGSAG